MPLTIDRTLARTMGFTFAPRALRFGVQERRGLGFLGADDAGADDFSRGLSDGTSAGTSAGSADGAAGATPNPVATPPDGSYTYQDAYRSAYDNAYRAAYDAAKAGMASTGSGAPTTSTPSAPTSTPAVYTPATATTAPASATKAKPAEEDHTALYVVGGVLAAAAVGTGVYFIARKKKRGARR